jgi:endonuclease YncB( thermonuclease family)
MALWSFPAAVEAPLGSTTFAAELDLGMRLYHPVTVKVAGIRPRDPQRLRALIGPGARVVVTCAHLSGGDDVRAHVALDDGRDLAAALRGQDVPAEHRADFGAGLDRVWRYPALPTKVVDGDSVWARFDVGVPTRVVNSIRVEHVDAWEKNDPGGPAATAFGVTRLASGVQVIATSRQMEKYGRILGTLTLPDGSDYGAQLIAAGHAVPYEC